MKRKSIARLGGTKNGRVQMKTQPKWNRSRLVSICNINIYSYRGSDSKEINERECLQRFTTFTTQQWYFASSISFQKSDALKRIFFIPLRSFVITINRVNLNQNCEGLELETTGILNLHSLFLEQSQRNSFVKFLPEHQTWVSSLSFKT